MNTETFEIREVTDEELALLNRDKSNLWVPIEDKQFASVLRRLSKKERKCVMSQIEQARLAPKQAGLAAHVIAREAVVEELAALCEEGIASDQHRIFDTDDSSDIKRDGPHAKRYREIKRRLLEG